MELCQDRRGEMVDMEYLSPERVELALRAAARRDRLRLLRPAEVAHARATRASTTSRGATSESNLVKVDVLLNGEPVDAFSSVVHRDKAYEYGKRMTERCGS